MTCTIDSADVLSDSWVDSELLVSGCPTVSCAAAQCGTLRIYRGSNSPREELGGVLHAIL